MITATITTATTTGARDHARAQASAHTDSMPVVPARDWPTPPVGVDAERLTWAETVPGGRYTSKILARGTRIRLRDIDGAACAHLLLWRAALSRASPTRTLQPRRGRARARPPRALFRPS